MTITSFLVGLVIGGAVGVLTMALVVMARSNEPQADADGEWRPWSGGQCPVPPSQLVYVEFREAIGNSPAQLSFPLCAGPLRWEHMGNESDIVAYRIHQ